VCGDACVCDVRVCDANIFLYLLLYRVNEILEEYLECLGLKML